MDASQAPEAGDESLDWEDQGSVDSRFSDTEGDSVLTSDRKSKRLLPLEVLRSLCPEAVQANEVQDRVLSASLNRLALQDSGKAQLFLLPSEGSLAARTFAEKRHQSLRGSSSGSLLTKGVPSFPGCARRGTVAVYKPSTFVPFVKDAFPGASLVVASDKVFSSASKPMSLSPSTFEALERQLAFAIESVSKIDSFTDGLAASLGESSLEEADPFTGSSFSLFDPCTDPRKVIVMLTHVSLTINETQKCLAVLRQNLVSLKRDHFLPPPGKVLSEDQCDSLRAMPAFNDSLFDGRLQLAKKLKSEENREDSFLAMKSPAASRPSKRVAPSYNRRPGPVKKVRLAEHLEFPPPYSSRDQFPSARRRGRGSRGASTRGTRGTRGAIGQAHPQ